MEEKKPEKTKPETEAPVEKMPVAAKPSSKPTVLLVEDDPLLTKMYKSKFESEGFIFLTANDGVEGLEKAQKEKIDIIILDLMMPKMSGIDLLSNLRSGSKGKNIPVIVLTNLTQVEEKQQALDLGVKEYLVKANQTPGQIVEKIKMYLGK